MSGHADIFELRALVAQVLADYDASRVPEREAEQRAVIATLALLRAAAPGRSVEVRIPPYAAVQVAEGGAHRRGNPRAVVEADPQIWLKLAAGALDWQAAVDSGALLASGERSDLRAHLPLL